MKFLIFLLSSYLSNFCFSQITDFEHYKISDLGYISIPKSLEIQSGFYKKYAESIRKEYFGYEILCLPKDSHN